MHYDYDGIKIRAQLARITTYVYMCMCVCGRSVNRLGHSVICMHFVLGYFQFGPIIVVAPAVLAFAGATTRFTFSAKCCFGIGTRNKERKSPMCASTMAYTTPSDYLGKWSCIHTYTGMRVYVSVTYFLNEKKNFRASNKY